MIWVAAALAGPFLEVRGVAQDGGSPQAGCLAPTCNRTEHLVASVALVDGDREWIVDATPDFPRQLRRPLAGVFLTHAHIGHYTGLMHLGREVMGAEKVPVYAMPRMRAFLQGNGPWDQLVRLENIVLKPVEGGVRVGDVDVEAILVPHRDEYSETVAFVFRGPKTSVMYLPDVDKWDRFPIETHLEKVDVALLDGTFYDAAELPGRDMAEIPHPFIVESLERLKPHSAKVRFIHLNHSNPALREGSDARKRIEREGFRVAEMGERIEL